MAAFTNTTIIADDADVDGFMGANVNAGFTTAMQDLVGVYTEAYLCNLVEYDIVTNWASLSAIYKLMFSEYAARTIAVAAISYEQAGFTTRIEAENMMNINLFRLNQIHKRLETASTQDFLGV